MLVQDSKRNVSELGKNFSGESYSAFCTPLAFSKLAGRSRLREEWLINALAELNEDIVFLDPDNGLSLPDFGFNTRITASSLDAVKYVLPNEVCAFYEKAKHALVIYHHLGRQYSHDAQVAKLVSALRSLLGTSNVWPIRCNRGSGRVFLIVGKPEAALADRVAKISQSFLASGLSKDCGPTH